MPNDRDNFPRDVVRRLRERVGSRCSNPECRQLTTGPNDSDDRSTIIGVAAHITAAAPGGPRYDPSLTAEERGSISNGIWLCQNHGRLIDADANTYPVERLRNWKAEAEDQAGRELRGGATAPSSTPASPITACSRNPAEQYQRSVALLRARDLMGWQQFKRSTRADLLPQVDALAARVANCTQWDEMLPHLDTAIPILAPTLVMALCAIESRMSEEQSQRPLIKDLLGLDRLSRAASPVCHLPENLAMVAHHVLGAGYVSLGMPAGAIDLLRQTYPHPVRRDQDRLINIGPAMGFSRSFNSDCTVAWSWMVASWTKIPWLTSFVTTRQEWDESLCAYHMLASLVEFACIVGSRTRQISQCAASTPLYFMTGDYDEFVRILNRAVPSGETIAELAEATGSDEGDIRRAWPQWVDVMLSTRAGYRGGAYTWNTIRGQDTPPLPQ